MTTPLSATEQPAWVATSFEIAAGRVVGADHRRIDRACQDAYAWLATSDYLVAAVCDGCSAGRFSEVGATLGARLFTRALAARLGRAGDPYLLPATSSCWYRIWCDVRSDVCTTIARLVSAMGIPVREAVTDYFLFTVVGAAITPASTAVFAMGDGVFVINGKVTQVGPFPGNQPPYLAYRMLWDSAPAASDPADDPMSIAPVDACQIVDTADIESIILASDGACSLAGTSRTSECDDELRAEHEFSQFLADRYFRNRDAIRRRLSVINRETCEIDWQRSQIRRHRGSLPDDTAIIAIRRRPAGES